MTEPAKEKMAPVQGFVGGIPWSLHLEAYNAYCKKWSPQPALIDLEGRNCRGGFGTGELDEFIPGWRDKVSEIGILKAELAGLRAKVAQQAALVEKCMVAMNENADRGEKAEAKLAALETHNTMLRACLKGVIRVADRKTDEFDAARAALGEQP